MRSVKSQVLSYLGEYFELFSSDYMQRKDKQNIIQNSHTHLHTYLYKVESSYKLKVRKNIQKINFENE